MSEPPVAEEPSVARPLEYAPPVRRARRNVLVGGLILSFVYAVGAAMIAMGLMLHGSDAATFVALGVFAIVLATGAAITFGLARL